MMRKLITRVRGSAQTRGTALTLVIQATGAVVGYSMQVVLARLMSPVEFGTFAFAYSWALLLGVFAVFGTDRMIVRFLPAYEAQAQWDMLRGVLRTTWITSLSVGVLISLAGLTLLYLGAFGSMEQGRPALALALLMLPLVGINLAQAGVLRACRQMGWAYAPLRILQPMLVIVLVGAAAWWAGSVQPSWAMGAVLIAVAITTLIYWLRIRRIIPAAGQTAAPQITERRAWLGMSTTMLAVAGLTNLTYRGDVLMVEMILGQPDQTGIYYAAARTAQVLMLVLLAANAMAGPMFAADAVDGVDGGYHRLQQRTMLASHLAFWPTLAGALVFAVCGKPVLGLFGPAFTAAYPELIILSAGFVVASALGPVEPLLAMTGHHRTQVQITFLSAAVFLVTGAAMIWLWGIRGAALAGAGVVVLRHLALYFAVRQRLGLQPCGLLNFTRVPNTVPTRVVRNAELKQPSEVD